MKGRIVRIMLQQSGLMSLPEFLKKQMYANLHDSGMCSSVSFFVCYVF